MTLDVAYCTAIISLLVERVTAYVDVGCKEENRGTFVCTFTMGDGPNSECHSFEIDDIYDKITRRLKPWTCMDFVETFEEKYYEEIRCKYFKTHMNREERNYYE